uniref:Thymidine kinase, cytosolic n=1 Tax=Globodera rostochiensis TaxID=31243 RepID=A0A914I9F1_GLORO
MEYILATDWMNISNDNNNKENIPPAKKEEEEEISWLRICDEEQEKEMAVSEEVKEEKPEVLTTTRCTCGSGRRAPQSLIDYLCKQYKCSIQELHVLLQNLEHRRAIVEHLRSSNVQLRTNHLRPPVRNFGVRCSDLSVLGAHLAPAYRGYLGITVRMHYYVKHSMRLRHANLPCVIEYGGGDHKTFFPLEVLSVVIKEKMAERVRRRLQHTQFTQQLRVELLRIVNIVGVHTCAERISVERLQRAIPGAIYDPTIFPALRCKIDGGATCLIYISGKVIVTGVRSIDHLNSSFKYLQLLRLGQQTECAGLSVMYIKHALDNLRTNNDSRVHTHDGETHEAVAVRHLWDVYDQMTRVKLICIDEGQFFSDLCPVVLHMVNVHKKRVIVAALNATFDQKMFPPIVELLPYADEVEWLKAVCFYCESTQAQFTRRFARQQPNNMFSPRIPQEEFIGGSEAYDAMCRKCLFHI